MSAIAQIDRTSPRNGASPQPSVKHDAFLDAQCDAEDAILGAVFVDPSCTVELEKVLSPSDFRRPIEREVFRVVSELYQRSPTIDVSGILREMRIRELADSSHGSAWIGSLANRSSVSQAITYYAPELRRMAKLLRLQRAAADAWSLTADPDSIASSIEALSLPIEPRNEIEQWATDDYLALRGDFAFADRGTEVIEGLLRAGEVMLVGSSSKHGKSWMVGNLIWAAIKGERWLDKTVRQGKVLLIDNELKSREIDWRHSMIARELHYTPQAGDLSVICRRGKSCDVHLMRRQLEAMAIEWDAYSLIIVDAVYKCIPSGASENDNAAMGELMNGLQGIAESTDVPIIGVHHSTKGQQGDKAVLDVFAGAGSFGRSLDSAVVMRDHEQPELSVIDFVSRTNPPQPAISARFDWPLWTVVTADPEVKRTGTRTDDRRQQTDSEADKLLLSSLTEKPKQSESQLVRSTGMGPTRISRAIGRAVAAGLIAEKSTKRQGRKVAIYVPTATETATP